MTLSELCNPLFLYVCFLNRSARKGAEKVSAEQFISYEQVRNKVQGILAELKQRAEREALMGEQFRRIETVLVFFVDSMIAESQLPFAQQWHENRLAYERGQLAGDERFFDLLDETLEDRGPEAGERLAVFYACLGLGFTGAKEGESGEIRRLMLRLSDRIRKETETDIANRICPEAYRNVDTRDLIQPPARSLLGLAIALIGLIIVLFVANAYLFREAAGELTTSLETIREHERDAGAGPQAPAEGDDNKTDSSGED